MSYESLCKTAQYFEDRARRARPHDKQQRLAAAAKKYGLVLSSIRAQNGTAVIRTPALAVDTGPDCSRALLSHGPFSALTRPASREQPRPLCLPTFIGVTHMNKDIAGVFEWFSQESAHIADQANEPNRRETFADLALLWAIAAVEYRNPPRWSTGIPRVGLSSNQGLPRAQRGPGLDRLRKRPPTTLLRGPSSPSLRQ
jgi:hypothetical protein